MESLRDSIDQTIETLKTRIIDVISKVYVRQPTLLKDGLWPEYIYNVAGNVFCQSFVHFDTYSHEKLFSILAAVELYFEKEKVPSLSTLVFGIRNGRNYDHCVSVTALFCPTKRYYCPKAKQDYSIRFVIYCSQPVFSLGSAYGSCVTICNTKEEVTIFFSEAFDDIGDGNLTCYELTYPSCEISIDHFERNTGIFIPVADFLSTKVFANIAQTLRLPKTKQ
jgi:hypothetical protein